MQQNKNNLVKIEDLSSQYGLIALQGPKAVNVLEELTDEKLSTLSAFHFITGIEIAGIRDVMISRTGYTGEDGFELYVPFKKQIDLWCELLKAGKPFGLKECGLGARDTLRLEAGLALYGNDLSESINPIEGGIGFFVKTGEKKRQDYPGKSALERYKKQKNKRISRGFELTGKGIARPGMKAFLKDGTEIGVVTSGTKSPTLGIALGFVLVDQDSAKIEDEIFIDIRNKRVPAVIVKKDWLKRQN